MPGYRTINQPHLVASATGCPAGRYSPADSPNTCRDCEKSFFCLGGKYTGTPGELLVWTVHTLLHPTLMRPCSGDRSPSSTLGHKSLCCSGLRPGRTGGSVTTADWTGSKCDKRHPIWHVSASTAALLACHSSYSSDMSLQLWPVCRNVRTVLGQELHSATTWHALACIKSSMHGPICRRMQANIIIYIYLYILCFHAAGVPDRVSCGTFSEGLTTLGLRSINKKLCGKCRVDRYQVIGSQMQC